MSFGWGIVSTARIADLTMAPAINAAEDSSLSAVCSRDIGRARKFSSKHGATAAYDSYEDMLKDPNVDAVYVASPNSLHAEHTIQAALAGKHVLCDKPMALTVEDCQRMVDTCKEENVKLGICFHLRHHPGNIEVHKLVRDNALGVVSLVQAHRGFGEMWDVFPPLRDGRMTWWDDPKMAGWGSMMASGVHLVDLLRYLVTQEVTEVAALTDGQTEERPLESLATLLLRFQDGALGMVSASTRAPAALNNIILHGSGGRIAFYDGTTPNLSGQLDVQTINETIKRVYTGDSKVTGLTSLGVGLYTNVVRAFTQAVFRDEEPHASGWDGLKATQIAVGMSESIRTGRTIKLEDL